jgi:hypothetical protein
MTPFDLLTLWFNRLTMSGGKRGEDAGYRLSPVWLGEKGEAAIDYPGTHKTGRLEIEIATPLRSSQ